MLHMRGHTADYDEWAQALGCAGWGWDEAVGRLFGKSRDTRLPVAERDGRAVLTLMCQSEPSIFMPNLQRPSSSMTFNAASLNL